MGKKFKKHPLEYEKIKQIYQLINDSAGAKAFLEALLSKNPSYSKAPQAQTMLDGISG